MASLKKRLPNNVSGDFFVDSSCINCDTCRQLAPEIFADDGEYSYVRNQPEDSPGETAALRALLACPTSSIGTEGPQKARKVMEDFPLRIDRDIYYCGFTSENSFGGQSYFIQHPEGNWMVDSPRWNPFLVKQFEKKGGLQNIFLTHRDDVADAEKYARHFGARRIIHHWDRRAMPEAELFLRGTEPMAQGKDFLLIPTPGHTRGHSVLLYKRKYLFSGDHLWWSRHTRHLGASRRHNWYSWDEQIRSMKNLQDYDFEWILPGHGRRTHLPLPKMKQQLSRLIAQMEQA